MAGFLYYIPGQTREITRDEVGRLGLGYAFPGAMSPCQVHSDGPDGGAGVVVADPAKVGKIGCYLQQQTWSRDPGLDVWVGIYNDARPGPADLEREDPLGGHWVTLSDGAKWHVPVARGICEEEGQIVYYHAVPRVSTRDDDGKWVPGDVVARYRGLWELACRWYDVRMAAVEAAAVEAEDEAEDEGDVTVEFEFDDLHDSAVKVIAQNYLMGPTEADLLGLLSERHAIAVLDALVDVPTQMMLLKKKLDRLAGSSSGDGLPDSPPDTGPR